jgi:hypothetical protein
VRIVAPLQVFLAKWKATPVAVKVLEDEGDALATLGSPILDKLRAVRAVPLSCGGPGDCVGAFSFPKPSCMERAMLDAAERDGYGTD